MIKNIKVWIFGGIIIKPNRVEHWPSMWKRI
jgi:hypothetical protein